MDAAAAAAASAAPAAAAAKRPSRTTRVPSRFTKTAAKAPSADTLLEIRIKAHKVMDGVKYCLVSYVDAPAGDEDRWIESSYVQTVVGESPQSPVSQHFVRMGTPSREARRKRDALDVRRAGACACPFCSVCFSWLVAC